MIGRFIADLRVETCFFIMLLCGIAGAYGALQIWEHDKYLIGASFIGASSLVYNVIYFTFVTNKLTMREAMWAEAEQEKAAGIRDDEEPVIDWKG